MGKRDYTSFKQLIDNIKAHSKCRLSEIMGEDGIQLTGRGGELEGYHSTKHGSDSGTSLKVDDDAGIYHCFNCGDGGGVFSYLEQDRGLVFMEALKLLADRAGIPLDNVSPEQLEQERKLRNEQKQLHSLYTAAGIYNREMQTKHYELLKNNWGLTRETANNYLFGYAPGGKFIISQLKQEGFDEELIRKSGLVNKGDYDTYNGRLLFPYRKNQSFVYFIGRQTADTPDSDYESAKYLKLPTRSSGGCR